MSINEVSPQNDNASGESEARRLLKSTRLHAYCILGRPSGKTQEVMMCLRECWDFNPSGNPDFLHYPTERISIEDARFLIDWSNNRPVAGDRKVCLIESQTLGREAQNALLKVLEDPAPSTHFFLIVPSKEDLLPTLRSRLAFAELAGSGEDGEFDVAVFMRSPLSGRLDMIRSVIDDKNKRRARIILDGIEEHLRSSRDDCRILRSLPKLKRALGQTGISVKMILEHVAHFAPFDDRPSS